MADALEPVPDIQVIWEAPRPAHDLTDAVMERVLRAEIGRRLPEASLIRSETSTDNAGEAHVTIAADGDIGAPDLAPLLLRHVPSAVIAQRVAYLRVTAVLPSAGDEAIVALDDRVDPATTSSLGGTTRVVALPVHPLEDAVAVLSVADAVVTGDATIAALGRSLGAHPVPPGEAPRSQDIASARPRSTNNTGGRESEAHADVDRKLDALAANAVADAARRSGITTIELQARRAAQFASAVHEIRAAQEASLNRAAAGRRRLDEALQDTLHDVDRLRNELAVIPELEATVEHLSRESEYFQSETIRLQAELDAVHATKTFRATAALRNFYGRLRFRRPTQ